jgi:transposase
MCIYNKMKKIDSEVKKEILEVCKNEPKRINEISKKYGISRMTIYNWLKEPVKIDSDSVKIDSDSVKIENYETILYEPLKQLNNKLTKEILEIYQNKIYKNKKEQSAELAEISKLCLDMQNIWGKLSVMLLIRQNIKST